MKLSARLIPFMIVLTPSRSTAEKCTALKPLPIDSEDFDQPNWKDIIEIAFPPWEVPAAGCPRLDKIGGALEEGFDEFPTPEDGKFNPCYYTKAFAGLDPKLGGYPTPVDTKYHYEFAAPFFKQPGDGSTHHCPMDASPDTPVQSCPKVAPKCDGAPKDCNKITDEFGIGHVPPFVPLAAVKNALKEITCMEEMCAWFADEVQPCNIAKSVLDGLVISTFGVNGTVKFTPPKILDDLPASDPKSTYYKLEYLGDPVACADDNCRGPHYCSKAAAEEDIWGDFCPYIHTGENSGLYRHPHIALAAVELMLANQCNPEKCPSKWLDSPNGMDYGVEMKSTSITWAEMDDNSDPMAQPAVPYKWPNSGDGIYPGHELYGDYSVKPAAGSYVTKFVAMTSGEGTESSGPAPVTAKAA
eukprot:CAMPEP_0183295548 /NCGR_PEP_ID=MMETSP0160_2-20130417/3468_1 /TAXON_ID=2839 ORGANISM="Odontella Sinensis, Strain Grunow 1884" /NCGR_SAMPLE_ID=MMETSP0160_2 /ASSEMBLY_ACC=CAM_ASM_000250 /LENGTH=412 /DNA_ID=CAMNT_0025457047 /DNA_START=54 /DNA_END=1288 /DNA_ORIENTATION=-